MSPGRKSINTISKSSSSTNEQHSLIKSTYECGSVVWCKYNKHPYWPGIILTKVIKSNRIRYEVLFFGSLSVGVPIDCKWLEPYEGLAKFQQRIIELQASEIRINNKPSQYDMNLTLTNLEEFQQAVKHASKVLKCSNYSERLQLVDKMRKGVTCDFFQLKIDDDEDKENEEENIKENETNEKDSDRKKEEENIEKNEEIIEKNEEEIIEEIIEVNETKEKDCDGKKEEEIIEEIIEENIEENETNEKDCDGEKEEIIEENETNEKDSDGKKEEENIEKNEDDNDGKIEEDNNETNSNIADDNTSILSVPPTQNDQQYIQTTIIEGRKKRKLEEDEDLSSTEVRRITTTNELEQPSMDPLLSILFRHSTDQPIVMCSDIGYHSLSSLEEMFILHAITHFHPDCTFFQAKQIAEETYSNIIRLKNSNRPLPVSEIWFYIFFHLHFEQLFSKYPCWLGDLEKTKTNNDYVNNRQQQLIRRMKTYVP